MSSSGVYLCTLCIELFCFMLIRFLIGDRVYALCLLFSNTLYIVIYYVIFVLEMNNDIVFLTAILPYSCIRGEGGF